MSKPSCNIYILSSKTPTELYTQDVSSDNYIFIV